MKEFTAEMLGETAVVGFPAEGMVDLVTHVYDCVDGIRTRVKVQNKKDLSFSWPKHSTPKQLYEPPPDVMLALEHDIIGPMIRRHIKKGRLKSLALLQEVGQYEGNHWS